MISTVLGLLESGLNLWSHKEKNQYVDELMRLRKGYYNEINKPVRERDHALLDHIRFDIELLALRFKARSSETSSPSKK